MGTPETPPWTFMFSVQVFDKDLGMFLGIYPGFGGEK